MSTSAESLYAAIYPDSTDVAAYLDGTLTLYRVLPPEPTTGPWAALWYEDEVYADSCHASSEGVHVAHYDWSLWYADLAHDLGRVDAFDPVAFATAVATDVAALGPYGADALRADAVRFLDRVLADLGSWDDMRADPGLHDLGRRILAGETFHGTTEPVFERPVSVQLPGGLLHGRLVAKSHTAPSDQGTWAFLATDLDLRDESSDFLAQMAGLEVQLPAAAIQAVITGPVERGQDEQAHYVGDTCSCTHYLDSRGELACGRDFMGGTICSLEPGHGSGCAATCRYCDGDWVIGTCTCTSTDTGRHCDTD